MSIIDEKKLLTSEEKKIYQQLLTIHGYEPYQFLVEVTEDQGAMDMNDINYIIILKIKITHISNNIEKFYYSKATSETWLSELEKDLINKFYNKKQKIEQVF